jgi:hypothetical protein
MSLGITHAQEVRQFEAVGIVRTEHLVEQTDISRVVLDQKNLDCLFVRHFSPLFDRAK